MESSMPHLESMFQSVQGSRCFAKIDLCHAYWQLALAVESQEIFSIQSPAGIYTPTRLFQGSTDAGNYFQRATQPLVLEQAALRHRLLQRLGGFLVHAQTEDELLQALHAFFTVCRTYGLKVHALKTELFSTRATFCGRIFDKDGTRFHPSKFEALQSMQRPELACDLVQFTCVVNWMRTSILNYAEIAAPLLGLLEDCYAEVGGRTKKKLRQLSLIPKWGPAHQRSFDQPKQYLADQTKLAFPKPDYDICLCTDASETHWSGVLTQVRKTDRHLPIEEPRHEPIGFLSGSFRGPLASWAIVEKEAYSIVESMIRFEHVVGGRHVSLYTDHSDLIYIFDPYGQNPGIARHTASKLMRWAVKLSSFRYTIEAIAGDANKFADLLARWAVHPHSSLSPDWLDL
jgi:RNase H-like domain found in reverse transcriptase/Reverse transcriptase (RNA-dependent DNA polymerase)